MVQKKYSINWENDEPVSFEVDGILYDSIDQVPDEEDRDKLAALMDRSFEEEFEKDWKSFDEEFKRDAEAIKKTSAKTEKVILGIFSAVAALMLLIALISSIGAVNRLTSEESAPGRVVDVVVQREYVNEQDRIIRDYYYPVVEFTASDGRQRSVQMSEGSSSPYYEAGDDVTVRYNPEHPLDARIQSSGSFAMMWILPGITGTLGLCFLVAVIVVRKFMPPTEEPEQTFQNELA